MKCEESCRILKIIYEGIISAIGNMEGWQNIRFFYVNISCMKCEDSYCILKILYMVNFYNRKYGRLAKHLFIYF